MTQVVRALTSWRVFPGEKLLRKGREWIFAMGALGWNVKISQNSWTVCFKRLKTDEDSKKREGNLLVMAVTACCSLRGKLLHLCVSLFWHSCWCQEENDTLLAQRRISGFWPRNLTAALYYPASKQISFDLVLATQYLLLGACCHQFTGISRAKVSPECCRSVPFSALTITSLETVWEMNAPEVFQMWCFKTRIVDDCWRRDWVCVCVCVLVDISSIFPSFSKCSTGGRPRKVREAFNSQSRRDLWCERNIRESKSNIFPICLSLRVPRSCFLKRRYRISKLQIWRNCCQGLRCRTLRNGSPQSQHFSLNLFAHLQCSVDVASLILWFLLWLVVLYFPHHPSVTESLQSEQKP